MTADLTTDFPVLAKLSAAELDEAITSGGLSLAFLRARIRQAIQTRKPGRPATSNKTKKVIQRRGRKIELQIHNSCTNIQLAELARAWRDTFRCTAREAVRQTFIGLGIPIETHDINRVAKLLSELPARDREMRIRRMGHQDNIITCETGANLLIMGQLSRLNSKDK